MHPASLPSRPWTRFTLVLAALTLVAGAYLLDAPRTASGQTAGMRLPTEAGTTWGVLAGYNTATHEGVDPYALDLWRIGAPTGGSLLLSPMNGEVGYVSDDCISVRNDVVNLLMCHVFPSQGLDRGMPVGLGQVIGVVAPDGQANNNGIAHIHLQLNLRSAPGSTGAPLPFTGSFALEGYEFTETSQANAHYGIQITSTNVGNSGGVVPGGAPTVDAGPDRSAAPGEVVTLTANAVSASTITWQQVAGTSVLPGVIAGTTVTFTAPAVAVDPLRFVVVAEGQGGVAVGQVAISVTAPATPIVLDPAPIRGQIVSGAVHPSGVSLIVFGGGTPEELVAAATCEGVLSIWASGAEGGFIRYAPSAPAFVNAQWLQRYPAGIPELTPVLVSCQ
jgi:hypothetical protein